MTEAARDLAVAIVVDDVRAAMDFYTGIFGAMPMPPLLTMPDGAIVHAEMDLGGGRIMLAERAVSDGGPARLSIVVDDVDAVTAAAIAAGAEVLIPVADQFYGHRSGRLRDPYGHEWIVSSVQEALSEAEMQARLDAMMRSG